MKSNYQNVLKLFKEPYSVESKVVFFFFQDNFFFLLLSNFTSLLLSLVGTPPCYIPEL